MLLAQSFVLENGVEFIARMWNTGTPIEYDSASVDFLSFGVKLAFPLSDVHPLPSLLSSTLLSRGDSPAASMTSVHFRGTLFFFFFSLTA